MPDESFAEAKTSQRFEFWWNKLQTTTEILVAMMVIAGLLGLFGTGPLSSAIAKGPGGDFEIGYERILRRTVQSDLTIELHRAAVGSKVRVLLPTAFLKDMSVASSSPRASEMLMESDGVTYVFDTGSSGMGEIIFSLKPKGYGRTTSPFVVDGQRIVLEQFIFP